MFAVIENSVCVCTCDRAQKSSRVFCRTARLACLDVHIVARVNEVSVCVSLDLNDVTSNTINYAVISVEMVAVRHMACSL